MSVRKGFVLPGCREPAEKWPIENIVLLGFRKYFIDPKKSIDVPQPSYDNKNLGELVI